MSFLQDQIKEHQEKLIEEQHKVEEANKRGELAKRDYDMFMKGYALSNEQMGAMQNILETKKRVIEEIEHQCNQMHQHKKKLLKKKELHENVGRRAEMLERLEQLNQTAWEMEGEDFDEELQTNIAELEMAILKVEKKIQASTPQAIVFDRRDDLQYLVTDVESVSDEAFGEIEEKIEELVNRRRLEKEQFKEEAIKVQTLIDQDEALQNEVKDADETLVNAKRHLSVIQDDLGMLQRKVSDKKMVIYSVTKELKSTEQQVQHLKARVAQSKNLLGKTNESKFKYAFFKQRKAIIYNLFNSYFFILIMLLLCELVDISVENLFTNE